MITSAVNRDSSIYYQSKTSSNTSSRGSREPQSAPIKGRDYELPAARRRHQHAFRTFKYCSAHESSPHDAPRTLRPPPPPWSTLPRPLQLKRAARRPQLAVNIARARPAGWRPRCSRSCRRHARGQVSAQAQSGLRTARPALSPHPAHRLRLQPLGSPPPPLPGSGARLPCCRRRCHRHSSGQRQRSRVARHRRRSCCRLLRGRNVSRSEWCRKSSGRKARAATRAACCAHGGYSAARRLRRAAPRLRAAALRLANAARLHARERLRGLPSHVALRRSALRCCSCSWQARAVSRLQAHG